MWGIECVISSLFLISKNMNVKFKGNLKDFRDGLNRLILDEKTGLITDSKGNTEFEFKEGEGIVGVIKEHEEDYKKVLAEVNFETGNVEFRDAGNYMEVPIEVIREVNKLIEIK